MAFCTKCGTPVDGDFCGNCGTKVGAFDTPAGPSSPPAPQVSPAYSSTPPVNIGAPKKRGPLFWILSGCGALVVIAGIVIALFFFFAWRVAKQAGLDPELMRTNPAMAVAKIMATVNPDLEVLSVDNARGVIRVREKKTGKILLMNLEDVKKGKITFKDEGSGESLTVGEDAKLPDWLPKYPGSEGAGTFGLSTNQENAATYTFKTNDPPENVLSFYEEALKNAGLEVEKPGGFLLTAKDSDSRREATVMANRQGDVTGVILSFKSKQ